MNTNICENQARITGEITSPYILAYTTEEGQCYKVFVRVPRLSGTDDVLPVIVPEFCLRNTMDATGRIVSAAGTFQSRNYHAEGKTHLDLFLYADQFIFADGQGNRKDTMDNAKTNNCIIMEGYLCKEPRYRKTPLGREIADFLLAVNETGTRRSFYIPCIAWGRNARLMNRMHTGESVRLEGRIQSREYIKRIQGKDGTEHAEESIRQERRLQGREYTKHFQGSDGYEEHRKVAYEVSCKHVYAVGQHGEPEE